MKQFADLVSTLDQTTKTNVKLKALVHYLGHASPEDRVWSVALLSGKRPRRTVNTRLLARWAAKQAKLPDWLFEESYHVVGDLAETISLVLPSTSDPSTLSLSQAMKLLASMETATESQKEECICSLWLSMSPPERFVLAKLITGGFRIGVSHRLITRALAQMVEIEETTLAHRLMGDWDPYKTSFEELISADLLQANLGKPYPFFLAYALDQDAESLGRVGEWQVERKWDGIRGQIIVRQGQLFIWSRGEELITHKFPEFKDLGDKLSDGTVLDGEIMAFRDGKPLDFQVLQTRIGRKNVTKSTLEKAPAAFIAYDLLELGGEDIRQQPMDYRRKQLEALWSKGEISNLLLSELVEARSWSQLDQERLAAREHLCEGLMLKRKVSSYQVGRRRGDWWKWKIDPYTVDAILIYAMRGHGRRANLYTDYTFAVWQDDKLVPFTKAYSGLTDKEFREIDRFVKSNTLERFGPVRSVKPELVFELAFEGISRSNRHKSGIALRFPRMVRWRKDKGPPEANSLSDLLSLLRD